MKFKSLEIKKPSAQEYKLLTDIIWGWDLGKLSWMLSEEESRDMIDNWSDCIIPCYRKSLNVANEEISRLVGYALVVPISMDEEELIQKERSCSHIETWDREGKSIYLSEIAIAKEYRGTRVFLEIMNNLYKFAKLNNITTIYTTAVSDDSRLLFANKANKFNAIKLATKEENREVWKLTLNKKRLDNL